MVSMFYLDYEFPLYEHFDGDAWKKVYIPWYPLFFRSRTGAIFYPRRGEGWYMRDDALAAIRWLERFVPAAKWRDDGTPITKQWEIKDTRFVVKEAWIFTPRDASEKPFAFLTRRLSPTNAIQARRAIRRAREILQAPAEQPLRQNGPARRRLGDQGRPEAAVDRKPVLRGGDHRELSPSSGRGGFARSSCRRGVHDRWHCHDAATGGFAERRK